MHASTTCTDLTRTASTGTTEVSTTSMSSTSTTAPIRAFRVRDVGRDRVEEGTRFVVCRLLLFDLAIAVGVGVRDIVLLFDVRVIVIFILLDDDAASRGRSSLLLLTRVTVTSNLFPLILLTSHLFKLLVHLFEIKRLVGSSDRLCLRLAKVSR